MKKNTVFKIVLVAAMLIMIAVRFCICSGSSGAVQESVSDVPELPSDVPDTIDAVNPVSEETTIPDDIVISLSSGDITYPQDVDTITVSDAELIHQLPEYSEELSSLKSIVLEDALTFTHSDIADLQLSFPSCDIQYRVSINGKDIALDTETLDLSGLPSDQVENAARELAKLPALKRVNLTPASAVEYDSAAVAQSATGAVFNKNLTMDQSKILEQGAPEAVFDYRFLLFGKVVSTADERIEYVDVKIGDAGVEETIRPILPQMTMLEYLKLDKCDVSSPVMAQLRDDFPDVKVVWRIYFSSYGEGPIGNVTYNCLTDTEHIWATGCVTDYFAGDLKYCTDVKYLDLGHNCITDISFAAYMPKLEVAVLSITWVEDLSPLASCPNLEYLEIFSSHITDITPLANCKNLKHLNISNLSEVKDITCLYELNLERLYCTMSYIPQAQQEEFQSLHPDCECEFGWVDPSKGYWRFIDGNYNNTDPSNRVERYAELYDQIGYGDFANLSC